MSTRVDKIKASVVITSPALPLSTSTALLPNDSASYNASVGVIDINIHPARALLGVLLSIFTGMTVFGNFLVIYAVVRQRYLRTITNYFIVSLATADLLMGIAVMPIAVIREVTQISLWPFGQDLCDLWHAIDVLSSTASIINLCLIALERYWATENPITYPTRMTKRRCFLMIAGGWICSSAISFPAIIWWRHADEIIPNRCEFTTDSYYLIISSFVSFYGPLFIMVFVYYRIYRTATNLIRSFNAGAKVIYKNGSRGGEVMVLRIHRGRNPIPNHPVVQRTRSEGDELPEEEIPFQPRPRLKRLHTDSSGSPCASPSVAVAGGGVAGATTIVNRSLSEASDVTDSPSRNSAHMRPLLGQCTSVDSNTGGGGVQNDNYTASTGLNQGMIGVGGSTLTGQSANKCITRKLRKFAVGRRLIKFNREQKAAKTLGIVMGIFIVCWLPFFICNIIVAADANLIHPTVLAIVSWFGYINSSINPVIYAHSMRDFRRAFLKLLCSCYLRRQRRNRGYVLRSNCFNSNTYASPSSSCRNPNYAAGPPPLPPLTAMSSANPSPNHRPITHTPSAPTQCVPQQTMETSFTSTSTSLTTTSPFRQPSGGGVNRGGNGFNGYLTPAYTPTHRCHDASPSKIHTEVCTSKS